MNEFGYVYHVSESDSLAAESYDPVWPVDVMCEALHDKIQRECGVFNSENSHGWPSSSIDVIQNPSAAPRLVNQLAGTLSRPPEANHADLSHEDLALFVYRLLLLLMSFYTFW